ncbi:MAG: hypothetical protein AAGC86_05575 [Pseudomonadota bacterium]
MALLHVSISAHAPEEVAAFLAEMMEGSHLPFPPFPGCWIAFGAEDDGTAVEVYPTTHVLTPGPEQIACEERQPDRRPSFAHVALASPLGRDEILEHAAERGWTARLCHRGPFDCVEVWLENRLLVELLDAAMLADYRTGMTAGNWAAMFGLTR